MHKLRDLETGEIVHSIGHSGVGGSLAFVIPDREVSMARQQLNFLSFPCQHKSTFHAQSSVMSHSFFHTCFLILPTGNATVETLIHIAMKFHATTSSNVSLSSCENQFQAGQVC